MVRNTPGVTSFVGSGNRPTPLVEGEVKKILKQMGVEAPKFKLQFTKGQSVRVKDGPFAEFIGAGQGHQLRRRSRRGSRGPAAGLRRPCVDLLAGLVEGVIDFLQIDKL